MLHMLVLYLSYGTHRLKSTPNNRFLRNISFTLRVFTRNLLRYLYFVLLETSDLASIRLTLLLAYDDYWWLGEVGLLSNDNLKNQKIKMNFIWKDYFFFFFAKIGIFCKSICRNISQCCSSVYTTKFVRRKDKTNYLSNQIWAKCYQKIRTVTTYVETVYFLYFVLLETFHLASNRLRLLLAYGDYWWLGGGRFIKQRQLKKSMK